MMVQEDLLLVTQAIFEHRDVIDAFIDCVMSRRTPEIDGREAAAVEGTSRMASKPVYWTYDFILLPVEPAGCLYIKVAVESSEFEPCPLEDPDVQAIVTGIRLD